MSEWVVRVEEELNGLQEASRLSTMDPVELWQKRCIYKVPASLKDLNKKAYEPQFVSFGPYHHGKEHLMRMEEHKHRALLHFLERSNKPLMLYHQRLLEAVQDLKDSYDSLDPRWQPDNRFLQLMILDGCFMLEFLRCNPDGPPNDYFGNDPIFSNHGELHILNLVRRDMLLVENQLPIMVLHMLVTVEAREESEEHVNWLVRRFWSMNHETILKGLHMLDMVRNSLVGAEFPHFRTIRRDRNCTNMIDRIGSAMDLYEAGIHFEKSRTSNMNDISFRDGVLSLPLMVVGNSTGSTLLNFIAFERLHIGAGIEMTNYVFFLGCILKSARDVSLLKSQGIVLNAIGSNQDIIEIFKSLSKEISNDHEDKLDQVYEQIITYRSKPFNRLRAHIVHAYHVSTQWSPWAYWPIMAAILLITLTILQTMYTIYPYYHPNK